MRLPPSPLPAKCPKVFEGETLGVDFLGVLEVNVRKGKRHLRVRPLFLGRVNVKFGVGSDASRMSGRRVVLGARIAILGSTVGRQIIRGVLGSILGGSSRK